MPWFSVELVLAAIALFSFTACSSKADSHKPAPPAIAPAIKASLDVFDDFLKTDAPPADGFDLPVDARLHVTKRFLDYGHSGEDFGNSTHPETALGQNVYAIANGRVTFADIGGKAFLNTIIIEHTFYENNEKRTINSFYSNLGEMKVKQGDIVRRNQVIATIGHADEGSDNSHLHLHLRPNETVDTAYETDGRMKGPGWVEQNYTAPTAFINEHRTLFVPQQESTLVLVDQTSYRMRLYRGGTLQGEYNVSFGQGEGQKRTQGDNKTPKGMYFIIQKHRGDDFAGPYGAYYGKHWMKINYPNKYDAAWGRSQGVINTKQQAAITASWQKRAATLENTGLGGGIGFHGWINEWDNRGPRRLSWGCVVMHISDVTQLFDQMPEGAMIVIF